MISTIDIVSLEYKSNTKCKIKVSGFSIEMYHYWYGYIIYIIYIDLKAKFGGEKIVEKINYSRWLYRLVFLPSREKEKPRRLPLLFWYLGLDNIHILWPYNQQQNVKWVVFVKLLIGLLICGDSRVVPFYFHHFPKWISTKSGIKIEVMFDMINF